MSVMFSWATLLGKILLVLSCNLLGFIIEWFNFDEAQAIVEMSIQLTSSNYVSNISIVKVSAKPVNYVIYHECNVSTLLALYQARRRRSFDMLNPATAIVDAIYAPAMPCASVRFIHASIKHSHRTGSQPCCLGDRILVQANRSSLCSALWYGVARHLRSMMRCLWQHGRLQLCCHISYLETLQMFGFISQFFHFSSYFYYPLKPYQRDPDSRAWWAKSKWK